MRLNGLIIATFVLALSAPAAAAGTVRIQQGDGSVKTYPGVTMKVGAGWNLTLISADKVSTVVVSGAACTPDGDAVRCSGGGISFDQDGRKHAVPFKTATFSFNLASNSVVFAITTAKGTNITGSGKLDGEPTQ